ncbi:peptidase_S9 domain-containing protein [Haematococcus lacustris]|uniref:Peptidase_S9 domain-containing protein n=1 Tax=Haematococcus lacustris TaxID=44745 RepID=A0A699ZFT7_HAELA|nr:peptidase_S9 domain-containing protein [Haematococcus lacustris]
MGGTGASPEGNRPFLDVLDIDTGTSTRLWQSSAPHYEQPGSIFNDTDDAPSHSAAPSLQPSPVSPSAFAAAALAAAKLHQQHDGSQPVALEGLQLTFTRESAQEPPQTFIKTFTQGGAQVQERRVTDFPHPYPA